MIEKYSIRELHQKIINGELKIYDIVKDAFARYKEFTVLNATVTNLEKEALDLAKKLDLKKPGVGDYLYGIPYYAKDNFCTKNILTTASSNILKDFVPTYESTATELLKNKDTILMGKTTLDELGMGGSGLFANTGHVLNPWDNTRITGGSSSGSAALVAAGVVPFALGSDTGDSIRKPASLTGIVGIKPTYGIISRYGCIPYAPSLDTVGFFTRSIVDAAIVLDKLVKVDNKDATSVSTNEKNFFANLDKDKAKEYKFAFIKEVYDKLDDNAKRLYDDLFAKMHQQNLEVKFVNFPTELLKAITPVYMIISFAEAVSMHSNLNGIAFGDRKTGDNYQMVMKNTRSAGFGDTVKRRYTIGAYSLARDNQNLLFLKAKKVRKLIVNHLENIFKEYDVLLLPPNNTVAPKIQDVLERQMSKEVLEQIHNDILIISNFAGNPSLTLPLGFINKLPLGINVNTPKLQDQKLLNASFLLESIINLEPEKKYVKKNIEEVA